MPVKTGTPFGIAKPKAKQPSCPACKSLNVYVTKKRIIVCRRCGRSHGAE